MTKAISRRMFLGTALGFAAVHANAASPSRSLRPVARPGSTKPIPKVFPTADELVRQAKVSGQVGYAVMDVSTGEMREAGEADTGLPPASVAKALTTLYALDALGEGHRFATTVHASGPVTDGVLDGDLILAGGGDPTLGTDELAQLAKTLKEAGLREVTGAFLVWGGALPFAERIDVEQPDHVAYSPAVSGLNLNFNRVHFQWTRSGTGYDVSMDAPSGSYTPAVSVAQMTVEDRSLPVYTYADEGGRDVWTVARGALGKGGARWLPVRKPEIYAGEVFQTLMRSHGIVLAAPKITETAPEGPALARVESGPLSGILRDMLKYSTNLTAEVVGLAATKARGIEADGLEASAQAMSGWLRETYGLSEGVSLVDHSGLGGQSRISAGDMVRTLQAAHDTGPLRSLMTPIPMRNEKRQIIADHPVEVEAKTGTLNFVSALAGYTTAIDGAEMAFAIFTANTERRDALSMDQRERPEGGRTWLTRSRNLQQRLLQRWGQAYANS
ncbi:D-alanyl-D-alanine carboxypeptidase/D-alanyl-D-alanine-endopeptidase [Marinovum sp.]|uniref:D-alanyl-D-alanine carboxypeptidase/D-alanyl-D-alanine endopeptidase n=1 Tax=Marinovum sp. TaxID=2024839 RepID=UPI002B26EC6B|nr:D-alanyl-D-alanine carboxypeptidase/D-alanyl-D-alanine-endopeptidase [Marinovum sp.]